jgi:hypothetical protein
MPEQSQPPVVSLAEAFAKVIEHVRQSSPNAGRFRIVFESDGERGVLPIGGTATVKFDMTPLMQRILGKLSELRSPQKRSQLAAELGLNSVGGQFSTDVKLMLQNGLLVERDKMISNDASKFVDMD